MRAAALGLAVLLLAVSLSGPAAAEDFTAVGKVNRLLSVTESPQLAPGERGTFRFILNSTYTEAISNVTLRVEVYQYATIDESVPVDANWSYPFPRISESGARSHAWPWPRIEAGEKIPLSFDVETSVDMPHGSVFSQSSYFLRFRIDFEGNVSGSPQRFLFASRGYFTEVAWASATNETNTDPCTPPWCRGNLNLTYLQLDGGPIDGLLPDSSFGVKEPIPTWPFYALVAATALFLVLAFLFWVDENPASFPRIAERWARARGRFVRTAKTLRPPKTPEG